ncbi:MAG: hypothetical protein HKN05_16385 [Rhizobiales bacterium]|nr:hypothetical protein [Hyphomicrobiales bacterium]
MIRHIIAIFTLFCCLLATSSGANAERRLALLIGINDYDHLPRLEKAVGDVNAMERKLKSLDFDVTAVINPDRRTLNIALGRFAARLGPNDLAFLHFSGHGVEIDGDNFLLPRDIPKPVNGQRDTVKYEAIGLRRLISQFNSTGARARVFVIDACRDNPFEQSDVRSIGSARGLARVEAPAGNFIMYSAGYRQLALDKLGPEDTAETSVYTRVLLSKLDQPGLPLAKIAREVRSEVQTIAQGIGHVQRPAYYDELSSSLVLVPEGAKKIAPTQTGPVIANISPVPATSDKQIELLYWNEVRTAKDPAILQSYLAQYPNGSFAPLAKLRIMALKNRKLKDEAAAKAAAEKKRLASLTDTTTDAADTEDNNERAIQPVPILSRRDLVIAVQRNLQRLGCTSASPDGAWGPLSRRALRAYARHGNVRLAALEPTQELLNELDVINKRVCPISCGPRHKLSNGRCVAKSCRRGEVLTSSGVCVERSERTKSRNRKAKVAPEEPRHSKTRSRAERRKKTKKRRAETRVRILRKDRHNAKKVDTNARGPSRKKKVCADRERALCQWDN